jgi:hypothetical protein
MLAESSCLNWTANIKLLYRLYSHTDPLTMISGNLLPKEKWKVITNSAKAAYYEKAATKS